MAILFLTLFLLILAAIVFGVFFLVFKLGWMIFGSRSNKGPMWTALAATLLLAGTVAYCVITTYNRAARPVLNLAKTIQQKTSISRTARVYKDPQFGFELTAFGGVEFSEWINYAPLHIQLGIDTNAIVWERQHPNAKNNKFPFFGMFNVVLQDNTDSEDQVFDKARKIIQESPSTMSANGTLTLQEPEEIVLASGKRALFVKGVYTARDQQAAPIDLSALITTDGKNIYVFSSMTLNNNAQYEKDIQRMLSSLRLP